MLPVVQLPSPYILSCRALTSLHDAADLDIHEADNRRMELLRKAKEVRWCCMCISKGHVCICGTLVGSGPGPGGGQPAHGTAALGQGGAWLRHVY